MQDPIISIVIPTYNPNLTFLSELLTSFKNLNKDKIEVLVVDDGSEKDLAKEILNFCKKFKVKYLTYDKNHGVSYARNFGVANSNGKYICFCDYDDFVNVDLLNKYACKELDENLYLFAYSQSRTFPKTKDSTELVHYDNAKKLRVYFLWPYIGEDYYSFRGCYCKLLKKDFLLKNNISFNEKLHFCEDTAFILECINASKEFTIVKDEFLYYHRKNEDSVTQKWNKNYSLFYESFFDYMVNIIKDDNILLPVYKDTVCVYSKVRICTSFKKLKFRNGLNFIKSKYVTLSCQKVRELNIKLKPEKNKFVDLILSKKFKKAYFYIVKNRILRKY